MAGQDRRRFRHNDAQPKRFGDEMETLSAVTGLLALLTTVCVAAYLFFGRAKPAAAIDPALEARLRELSAKQSEISGRFGQSIETQSHQIGDLQRMLAERLEALDQRLGSNLQETAAKTAETLGGLQARLSVIDQAQKNLTDLSGQVVSLQQILANKQTRGAFGQAQMEGIIRDALPAGFYSFQATLSNRSRPDCLIHLPNTKAGIVIDSKFPLECFELYRAAASDGERRLAAARVRTDLSKHIKDIADKYLIPGETQDPALMFIPSESVYAELHENFGELIQQAQRARVVVVSPNILLLAINTVQTVLKDARMREQANLIQREVGELLKDSKRLCDRVNNLQRHFDQTNTDLKEIVVSTDKIARRAERIEQVDLSAVETVESKRALAG
jgi:DNA recombination protein RmuC